MPHPGPVTSDEALARWRDGVADYDVPHLRLRQVARLVGDLPPGRLLDVGCATGYLRKLCPGRDYIGWDFVTPDGPIDFPFYRCDFNREPLPAGASDVDTIVCSGVLEYVTAVPAFLGELRLRLRPAGHLVCTYFNMNHLSRALALLRGRTLPAHPDWRGLHAPAAMARMIRDAGFTIRRIVPSSHGLRASPAVSETTSKPLTMPRMRPWSWMLAHQFIFLATPAPSAPP